MTIRELAEAKQSEYKEQIILAKLGTRLSELKDVEVEDEDIEFITTDTTIGNETYRRSIIFLMLSSINRVAGMSAACSTKVHFSIGNGLYCSINDKNVVVDEAFIKKLKDKMIALVLQDLPIKKATYPTAEAVKIFDEQGMKDKGELFRYRKGSKVNVYELDGYCDYFYGYMAPSTGKLDVFDLTLYSEGFILSLPKKSNPTVIPQNVPSDKLYKVFDQSEKWANIMECNNVADLNKYITEGRIHELVLVQEALQEQKIAQIAQEIASDPKKKLIMIAGPSSSGKTTFSHRLSIQLKACGLKPHPIPVDDYFVEREETPLDEYGQYDFESLHAVDIELFNDHMKRLLAGECVEMPTFNFKIGHKEYNGKTLQLGDDDILVIEGIHCLNDELSYSLPKENKYKIYISALTQLNIDEHNRVATTDGRLIRRMVRDFRTRGASPKRTLGMWDSVRRGEEKNIFPFQEQSDAQFNSALIYELALLKPYAEAILYSIKEDEPEYFEAKRLLKFLQYFLSFDGTNVPNNSLAREFIGGGCFKI